MREGRASFRLVLSFTSLRHPYSFIQGVRDGGQGSENYSIASCTPTFATSFSEMLNFSIIDL